MKNSNKPLFVVKFLVEEGAEDVDLVRQRRVLPTKIIEPKPGNLRMRSFRLMGKAYLRPNSMRVSLRYSSGCSLLRSLCMMLSAPVPVGGYIRTLGNGFETDCYIGHIKLTLRQVLTEPVVGVGVKSPRIGLRTVSQSGGES